MPRLGEVLGALLADATQARVLADLEAVKIADAYSRDPLLKHLPVPRFRLPDITVDVPVLVAQVEGTGDSPSGLPFDEPSRTELRNVVRAGLRSAAIRLPRTSASAVPVELIERAQAMFRSGSVRLLRPAAVADDIASMLVDIVRKSDLRELPDEKAEQLHRATGQAMSELLATKLRTSLSWQVAVTAGEIKTQADTDSIVRLRLTLSEDGYEMVTRDDGQGFSLTPE